MINRNLLHLILLLILLPIFLIGCSHEESRVYRIGVSQCSDDDWRTKLNEEIRRELLFHEDATVDIRTARDDNARQIADIEYFIKEGYDIIIAAPNQAEALTPVLSKAYKSGIPVVIFDRGIEGDSYTSFIEFDNHGIGLTAADYTVRHLPEGGKVVELFGLSGSTPTAARHAGFAEGLARHPEIELIGGADGEWKQDVAARKMDSLIKLYPDLKLVYAHNDLMAIGASEVLRRLGRRDVMVLGTDAVPKVGMRAVMDTVIDATFIYPTDGQRLIQTAMAILKGEPYEKNAVSPALPPVDLMNAEILCRQNKLLTEQTDKILMLKAKNDDIVSQYKARGTMLYLSLAVGLLLVIIVVMLLWYFWQRVRIQRLLTAKNAQLQTEKEKQEELYRQLDDATKAKLTFFTNVSHDLRTPLTLISESVNRLASSPSLNARDNFMMKMADKNVRILRRMIDQILDLRGYENGQAVLSLSEVKVTELVGEWVSAFKGIADKRGISLVYEPECDGEETLAIDVDKMERVVFNLVSNAFKYSADDTVIRIICRIDSNSLIISVADKGCGISKEDLEKIFDRFYQVDKSGSDGFGLGLAVAKAFIELHGGTLTVESTYGEGSKFTINIPVRHVEEATVAVHSGLTEKDVEAELSAVEPEAEVPVSEKPVLLLIDDNEDLCRMGKELLSEEYTVITALDGKTGLRLATRYVPDIIICDIMMPVMDGLECCRLLKGELSTSHIPVLILTACGLDERRMESYDSGADGFLSKPFDSAMLLSRCRNLIENRRRIKDGNDMTCALSKKGPDMAKLTDDLNDKDNLESVFYKKFLSVIRENYTNADLNTTDIASHFGLGPAQLTRKIKALTNSSPVEILKDFRLKKARELLISTDANISEIAYDVGFSSPPYLSKCFREAYGETPTELRVKMQGQKKGV